MEKMKQLVSQMKLKKLKKNIEKINKIKNDLLKDIKAKS